MWILKTFVWRREFRVILNKLAKAKNRLLIKSYTLKGSKKAVWNFHTAFNLSCTITNVENAHHILCLLGEPKPLKPY